MTNETPMSNDEFDDFEDEVAETRRNAMLMALLDERGKQAATIPLDEVKRQLGF
jgi:hypothetical protein